jgi:hypothetical protein
VPLAGGFAGLAIGRLGAIMLTISRSRVRNKKVRQQRHLRRFCKRLIVSRTWKEHRGEENQKEAPEEAPVRRRKKSFGAKCWKKTDFQTANSPPLSFRR